MAEPKPTRRATIVTRLPQVIASADRRGAPKPRWCRGLALVVLLAIQVGPAGWRPVNAQVPAAPSAADERQLKAVFLYSLGRYVTWPASAFSASDAPFVIGLLGGDPFQGVLDEIASRKTVQDRAMRVVRFQAAEEVKDCQMLFVASTLAESERTAVLAKVRGRPVLVASDLAGFAEHGGLAALVTDAATGTVRVEMNLEVAKHQGLTIDAKMLSIAKVVKPPTSP